MRKLATPRFSEVRMPGDDPKATPPTSSIDEETDLVESGDEQVLDELAVNPTPTVESDSDLIDGDALLPGDLPGRASSTDEDLSVLFADPSHAHLDDGFTGSGDSDGDNISQNDGDDVDPGDVEHPEGA
jgi:hypothetical protein